MLGCMHSTCTYLSPMEPAGKDAWPKLKAIVVLCNRSNCYVRDTFPATCKQIFSVLLPWQPCLVQYIHTEYGYLISELSCRWDTVHILPLIKRKRTLHVPVQGGFWACPCLNHTWDGFGRFLYSFGDYLSLFGRFRGNCNFPKEIWKWFGHNT